MTFLIIEGTDCSGKTSTIGELHKATNFKYSCIDRFSGTSFAYGLLKERNLDISNYIKQDIELFDKCVLIYLEASEETIKQRFRERGEDFIKEEEINDLKEAYEKYLEQTPLYIIRVNTEKDIKNVVNEIIEGIRDFENESPISKVERLSKTINAIGEEVSGTKELRNIEMNFDYGQINEDKLYRHLQDNELWDPLELNEYNEIKYTLINQIRLKLHYFKNQDEYSRQFTYKSDSCISFVQVMKRNDELEFYFTIRSSNVEKMLLLDIYGINGIADEINQQFFNLPYKINLRIISAHLYQ